MSLEKRVDTLLSNSKRQSAWYNVEHGEYRMLLDLIKDMTAEIERLKMSVKEEKS